MKKIYFILFFLAQNIFVFTQQNKTDSLWNKFKTAKQDTAKANILLAIADEFYEKNLLDSAEFFSRKVIEIVEEPLSKSTSLSIKDTLLKQKAQGLNNIGLVCAFKKQFESASDYYHKSLSIRKSINDNDGIAWSYSNIGYLFERRNQSDSAIEYHLKALKIRNDIRDEKGAAFSLRAIGLVYNGIGNHIQALNYFYEYLNIAEAIRDSNKIARVLYDIGFIYKDQGDLNMALEKFKKSLKIREAINDIAIPTSIYGIGLIYKDIGDTSLAMKSFIECIRLWEKQNYQTGISLAFQQIGSLFENRGEYLLSLTYYKKGLAIALNLKDKIAIAIAYKNISSSYFNLDNLSLSKTYADSSMVLLKETGNPKYIMTTADILRKIYRKKNDYKNALLYNDIYFQMRDSINNEGNRKESIKKQYQYEYEKKEAISKAEQEKKDAIASIENKKQTIIIFSVVGILIIVLFFAGIIFRSLNITKKQKHLIQLQKTKVEAQKQLIEEHQKEITDSIKYAKRLQEAILPPAELIKNYFPNSFVLYKPKDIVAGDFYWMESCAKASDSDGEIVFIAAADCTGHGVPGAMVSVVCSNALNRAVKEFGLRDTGKILDKVTDLVLETFEKSASEVKDGMDISLLAYNMTSKQIQWSGANNPLWYIHNGQVVEIKADKQPVGKFDKRKSFTAHSIEHSDNSVFYLFTDGLPDQFGGPKGKKFMYKRFENNLSDISKLPMDEQQAVLEKAFQDWKGSLEQVDDVTVIGIKI